MGRGVPHPLVSSLARSGFCATHAPLQAGLSARVGGCYTGEDHGKRPEPRGRGRQTAGRAQEWKWRCNLPPPSLHPSRPPRPPLRAGQPAPPPPLPAGSPGNPRLLCQRRAFLQLALPPGAAPRPFRSQGRLTGGFFPLAGAGRAGGGSLGGFDRRQVSLERKPRLSNRMALGDGVWGWVSTGKRGRIMSVGGRAQLWLLCVES